MKGRILVADDDPSILRLLQVNFRLEGYEVAVAANGEEALAQAADRPPDAIVLDVMMPGIDGWEVAARLKADPVLQKTPIILLTARSQEADRRRGMSLGAFEYVTKPFDLTHLLEVVARAVSASTGS